MLSKIRLLPLAACFLAGSTLAQNPVFTYFGNGNKASDVVTLNGDVVVVGTLSSGNAFRWTSSTGVITDIGPVRSAPVLSRDGTVIAATTRGADGIDRASRWVAGVWTQGPGLGGISGVSESTALAISGDGSTITGLAWISANLAHCFAWSQSTGIQDLGMTLNPSSRGNTVNFDGSLIAGFHDDATGIRQGAYWIAGVEQTPLTWFDAATSTDYQLGMVNSVNGSGTVMVGGTYFGATAMPLSAAGWRWDALTGISTLENLPGELDPVKPLDVSDDGSLIVGNNGWNPWFSVSTLKSVIWVNNVPQSLFGWASALGTTGMGVYTELGYPAAISPDGKAICGSGGGFQAPGTPNGGWVIVLPQALENGVSVCEPGTVGVRGCPCANPPAGSGVGCNNSSNTGGARIRGTGASRLSADGLKLVTSGQRPSAASIVLQGNALSANGAAFGQGVRCVTGLLKRMYVKNAVGGSISVPAGAQLSVSARSANMGDPITAGSHRYYGVYYRDPIMLGGCSSINGYNITQQLDVTWMP